jgi:glycosyltransferase involved in cell wall biosynthesis
VRQRLEAPESQTRLLRIVTRLNIGGPARHVILLHEGLPSHGLHSALVSGTEEVREGRLLPSTCNYTRIPALRRAINPLADYRAFRALIRQMHSRRPHVVHTHMAKAGALGRLAARRTTVPVVVHTFHGHVLSGYFGPSGSRLLVSVERKLADKTDALIAVSGAVRDDLLALGIGRPSQWSVIPLGLNLENLTTQRPSRHTARMALGLPPEGPIIGIVARLVHIKDHDTFLRSAMTVARAYPSSIFVIAGDGEMRRQLEARAKSMLGDRVRFLGWVSDLPTLYGACDVIVLTSRNEGTPVALIEAGAAACPVIATRVGGVPDVVRDGVTGFLVPTNDPGAVAQGVLDVVGHPDRASKMGDMARSWVTKQFSAKRLIDDHLALYTELLARRGFKSRAPTKAQLSDVDFEGL